MRRPIAATAAPAPSGNRRQSCLADQLDIGSLITPSPPLQPGRPPYRPSPDSIDGQISELYRQLADGEIGEAEAARRDAALRRRQHEGAR